MLALHDQPDALQDTQWAEATAAGTLPLLNTYAIPESYIARQRSSLWGHFVAQCTLRKELCQTKQLCDLHEELTPPPSSPPSLDIGLGQREAQVNHELLLNHA